MDAQDLIRLTVPGEPRPQARSRTGKGRHYDPEENRSAKRELWVAWQQAGSPSLGRRTLGISVLAYFRRPKSHYGTGRNADKLKPNAPYYKPSWPDASNILKLVEDALQGYAFHNDAQIATARVTKQYDVEPSLYVVLWPL